MTMFYWRERASLQPRGASKPTPEEFKAEVLVLNRKWGGEYYRPHAFENCIYDSRRADDSRIFTLWALRSQP